LALAGGEQGFPKPCAQVPCPPSLTLAWQAGIPAGDIFNFVDKNLF
jgi:hypothetical protein